VRSALKKMAFWLATLAVLPSLASYWLRAAAMGRDRALEGSTQALALVPGLVGRYARRAFLARALAACHPTATVEFGTLFSSSRARLDVLIGAGVHIPSGSDTHGVEDVGRPIREQVREKQEVRIGHGTWIGSAAVVMSDVGHDSVVGAGSVVTRPVPALVVAAGVPARVIRQRSAEYTGP
jgi:virginiamycin A acetyltransferase